MSETTIHAIKSITAFKIQDRDNPDVYSVRYFRLLTESGVNFDLTLFAEDGESLEIIESEEER